MMLVTTYSSGFLDLCWVTQSSGYLAIDKGKVIEKEMEGDSTGTN